MRFSRRDFLQQSAAVAAGFGGLQTLSAYQSDKDALRTEGYGMLQPDPAQILELPITLGQVILRSETAALYTISALNYEMQSPRG